MAEIHDLNPTDASNTQRFPENQAPSSLNDGGRALEGLIARYFFDENTSVEATLSGSLLTLSTNRSSLTLTGTTSNYVANTVIGFTMGSGGPNTGPLRMTVNGIGAKELRDNKGLSLTSSVLLVGTRGLAIKDATNDYWRLVWPEISSGGYTDPLTTRGDLVVRGAASTTRLAVGASGSFPASDGTDVAYQAMATQANQEAASSVVAPVTPGRQHFHPSAAKAWCLYNHDTASILASYNVTSVTDNSVGDLTVNWDTDFSSANYAYAASAQADASEVVDRCFVDNGGQAAGSLNLITYNSGPSLTDMPGVSVVAFGDFT